MFSLSNNLYGVRTFLSGRFGFVSAPVIVFLLVISKKQQSYTRNRRLIKGILCNVIALMT
jgi:hypothetical protein